MFVITSDEVKKYKSDRICESLEMKPKEEHPIGGFL